ncbi:acetate/propionate family kinase [Mycoplasmopsis cynos]|uniref:acetate/propionate family kinase n=1 Tax=Mycoplasmopsis cynos TaxID=171284 RepID=UPI0022021090|nr:acetate/propionate family kinase [Mycoplasmopsis cynos]UWV92609.1 acetate/propionate family kinase [Mycoplasmopsis cynos]WQQ19429.1 acetate/propionate family kinase [Mycoplasmopsis cynos]
MSKILVINAGSSSIKISLFLKENYKLIANGIAERITLDLGKISIKYNGKKYEKEIKLPDYETAINELYKLMHKIELVKSKKEIQNIGFRVVQGGNYINNTVIIDQNIIDIIDKCSIYAPLHNPGALQSILGFRKVFPEAILTADFDTSFHSTIEKVNYVYPINKEITEKYNVRKYGAHGISHQFITEKLSQILDKDRVTFINLHLGNGASICAVKDSKSIDTSMGLTPLAGIMMGTRSGDIDPSIHQFVMKSMNINIDQFTNILNKESGLMGVSGISSDMRDLRKAIAENNKDALFALELFTQKIADYTSIYFNKLGGKIDAIVFTAGIGENNAYVRSEIINKLYFRKIKLSQKLNNGKIGEFQLISTFDSEIPVYVIRTNEELVIARNSVNITVQNE